MASGNAEASEISSIDSDLQVKHFHIFGNGISFSISPVIHVAGFRHYSLPHTYDIQETRDVDEVVANLIEDSSFGGASVTMPHKLAVHRFCHSQTEHALKIGAVNTLIVSEQEMGQGRVIGDNTDWSGLFAIIDEHSKSAQKPCRVGLVIGAGGASRAALYALYQAGLTRILLVNRTAANAEKIAQDYQGLFHVEVVSALHSLPEPPDVIIGTIPADRTSEDNFRDLFSKKDGLCIDMSYKPRLTPLLVVAQRSNGWKTVNGVTVLLHQAYDQFQLWTGLPAPRTVMQDAVIAHDIKEVNITERD